VLKKPNEITLARTSSTIALLAFNIPSFLIDTRPLKIQHPSHPRVQKQNRQETIWTFCIQGIAHHVMLILKMNGGGGGGGYSIHSIWHKWYLCNFLKHFKMLEYRIFSNGDAGTSGHQWTFCNQMFYIVKLKIVLQNVYYLPSLACHVWSMKKMSMCN
jgi:hypothetical protein